MPQVYYQKKKFVNELFLSLLVNYWRSAENQRKFFIEFASQRGFDPLVPDNWKKIKRKELIEQVGKPVSTTLPNF